ncbi:MAG: histidine--tRNA ligase [Desulfomonile sp.]|nr:histidine--tRNA ligase [Desulfomonile sp.]
MIRLIKGFHDILPEDTPKWDFLVRTAKATLEAFGYREIVPPIMERTELFARGIGELTDIVEKEMYTFEDKGGETLSLRPEATAGILRAVVEHALLRQDPILKLYAIGPMFRRERPSKGRFRQFFQVDAEVLGDDSPQTDAETILAAYCIMENIGAQGLMMEINSVGCPVCRATYREVLRNYLEPHLSVLCDDCRRRYERNPLRVLDCKVDRCVEIAAKAPLISNRLDESCREHFDAVKRSLELVGVPFREEPRMVRGLDYYTRTAFEIVHEELGRSKAVGGGGRYDNLIKELGGPEVSGIGFAIGLERLSMGIPDDDPRFARSIDVYVAPVGDNALNACFTVVNALRRAGLSCEARYTAKSLKSHMRAADRCGAQRVIMIGEDELARNEATVRDMTTKEQTPVKMDELVNFLLGEKR